MPTVTVFIECSHPDRLGLRRSIRQTIVAISVQHLGNYLQRALDDYPKPPTQPAATKDA